MSKKTVKSVKAVKVVKAPKADPKVMHPDTRELFDKWMARGAKEKHVVVGVSKKGEYDAGFMLPVLSNTSDEKVALALAENWIMPGGTFMKMDDFCKKFGFTNNYKPKAKAKAPVAKPAPAPKAEPKKVEKKTTKFDAKKLMAAVKSIKKPAKVK